MKRPTVLIVGAGNVGLRLIALLRRKFRVFATTSTPKRRAQIKRAGANPLVLNLDRSRARKVLRTKRYNAVVHLAPPNTGPLSTTRDQRTRTLVRSILTERFGAFPFVFAYVSTSGVYGDCAGQWVSESRPTQPYNARAKRRVDAERVLMKAAKRRGWRTVVLRAPGIYDAEHLPIERLRKRLPAIVAHEDSYTNHIHADDLARMCAAALGTRHHIRIYNANDDSALLMGDWFDLVADTFGLERPPRVSRAQAQQGVSPMLWSFMRESRRLSNARIKRELRVRLQWPTVEDFLRTVAQQKRRDAE
ncbi:MAG TPA: NAD-dependent epimerase/dehydratase family protein [Burkholderiaceae bacterium]|nr:NAD-dependent epimerase/dehydratase family protein [Burkholderiaceae bacterium]